MDDKVSCPLTWLYHRSSSRVTSSSGSIGQGGVTIEVCSSGSIGARRVTLGLLHGGARGGKPEDDCGGARGGGNPNPDDERGGVPKSTCSIL